MKKLVFLCHGAGNGGAERVITTLASEFANNRYEVFLFTTNEDNNDYEINKKIKRVRILSNKSNSILRTIDRIGQMRKLFMQIAPDCIISFSSVPNMQALVAHIGLKGKIIISERTDPSKYPTSKIGKILRNLLYPGADRIVFQTKEAMECFPNRIKRLGLIIPNPIRNDIPTPYEGERKEKIVGIGSLGEQKNWPVALKAARIFFERFPNYTFEIYGEGPDRVTLEETIKNDEWLNNRVFLMGFSRFAVDQMREARMYLSSSNYEGISNSMLEALAVGTPTICTDAPVGGARLYIKDGINGFLVNVGDYRTMASRMIELAENEMLSREFSKKSIMIRDELSLDKIVCLWEKEIER